MAPKMIEPLNFLQRRSKGAHYLSFAPRTVAIDTLQQVVVNSPTTTPKKETKNSQSDVMSKSDVVSTAGQGFFLCFHMLLKASHVAKRRGEFLMNHKY
jgi:hypothetical protein